MQNVFWYYCIAAIGIFLIIFTMYKKRNVIDLLSFFLSVTSLAYICEVVILFVFNSYQYKPGLFSDPIAESIFGHLICNGFYWGGFSLLVAAFSLRYLWIFIISVFFMLTEVLFLKLGIYTHHWWKLYMTGICAFLFLTVVKKWFQKLKKNNPPLLRYFTFYLIGWLLLLGPSIILLILERQHYSVGWVKNMYRDDILFNVPYHLILSVTYILFINLSKKLYWSIIPLLIVTFSDFILAKMNILIFQNDWNMFYLTLLNSLCLTIYIMLEKNSLKNFNKEL